MILYHGTAEPFEGPPRPSDHDGLLWTTPDPRIARIYIPEAGVTQYWATSRDPEDRLRPSLYGGDWEVARSLGYIDVPATYDKRGDAVSWTGPTPRYAELLQRLADLGYSGPQYRLKQAFIDGMFRTQPATWKKPGRLYALTVPVDLRIARHPSCEHDSGDPAYHALDFFRAATNAGYDAVKIADCVQDYAGNHLGHDSIGLTIHGAKRIAAITVIAATHSAIESFNNNPKNEIDDCVRNSVAA